MNSERRHLGQPIAPGVHHILEMLMDDSFEEPTPVLVQATMDEMESPVEISSEDSLSRDVNDIQAQVNLNRVRDSDVLQELSDFDMDFLFDPVGAPPVQPPSFPASVAAVNDEAMEEEKHEPPRKRRKVEEKESLSASGDRDEDFVMLWEDDKFGLQDNDDAFEPKVVQQHILSDYCEIAIDGIESDGTEAL